MNEPDFLNHSAEFRMDAARAASDANQALALADPRIQAAMSRLRDALGITLDGADEGELVQDQVAFYQASVLLARVDAADPLRRGSDCRGLLTDQSSLLANVEDALSKAEYAEDLSGPGLRTVAAEIISIVRAFDQGCAKSN